MSWYTLQTTPNYEGKVTLALEDLQNKGHSIREIFAPIETIFELKNGVKKEKKKRVYTNYIFVELDYNDNIWHALKGVRGVVGFVGNKGKPTPLSEKEIDKMKSAINGDVAKPKIIFDIDTKVRIKEGSFADFFGKVKSVDYTKNKAKVSINIFNRETEVDIELNLLELSE